MILRIVGNKRKQVHRTAHLATIFMDRTIPGCILLPTIGINIREIGVVLPTYELFKSTIGFITMEVLQSGTTRRKPFITGSILLPVPGVLVGAMSRRISVAISELIRVPSPMVHGTIHRSAPVLSHTGFTTGFIGPAARPRPTISPPTLGETQYPITIPSA